MGFFRRSSLETKLGSKDTISSDLLAWSQIKKERDPTYRHSMLSDMQSIIHELWDYMTEQRYFVGEDIREVIYKAWSNVYLP